MRLDGVIVRNLVFLFLLVLVGCGPSILREGGTTIPDWVAKKFYVSDRSVSAPEFTANQEIVFSLKQNACTGTSDRTGPSDCATRTSRSVLKTGRDWQLENMNLVTFEVFVDPTFANSNSGSQFVIARFQAKDVTRYPLFDFKLDRRRGITFQGKTCAGPKTFGTWQRVFVRVRWDNSDQGFLEVRCGLENVHEAPVVFAQSGFATNRSLVLPKRNADPKELSFQLGLIAEGRNGAFQRLPNGKMEIKFRRLAERRLYVLFNLEDTVE